MSNSKIDLIFLRHGQADWPNWKGSDDDRPLTEDGKKETHEVAAFLAKLALKPQKIFTSPLPRASQTAEIAAEHLRTPLVTSDCLAKGFGVRELKKLLDEEKIDNLMLVGHEPDLSTVIEKLTGGDVKLKKSGVARLRLNLEEMSGQLLWLFPPAICRAGGTK
ncbi:MAG: phosphohistidine phosphatase [Verrucomicrobiota bacterium]